MLKLLEALDFQDEISSLYAEGMPSGESTGWPDLDEFYTIQEGFWTIVTGIPSHGKSTWLDNLMLNLIRRQTWRMIVYSPENQPHALHISNLVEKLWRRPFRANFHNRLTEPEVVSALNVISNRVRLLKWENDGFYPTLWNIQEACDQQIADWKEKGYKVGVIVDPWNELDHTPLGNNNETQWTNFELMNWRQWIRDRRIHGWIVAHPQKPTRDKNGKPRRPGLYDINGSAAYYNKADHGIIVHRLEDDRTEIEVEKCRFRHLGKKGSCFLRFNSGTQTYESELTRERRYGGHDNNDDPERS